LRQQASLDERFGYEYRSHDESGAGPDEVLVLCDAISAGAPPLRIKAKKLVKAFGDDVQAKGTMFTCRDRPFPTGLERWWAARRRSKPSSMSLSASTGATKSRRSSTSDRSTRSRSSPTQAASCSGRWARTKTPPSQRATHEIIKDHLTDVIDREGVHLSYLDQLSCLPLYEVDLPQLSAASREASAIGIGSHMLYNMAIILNAVPRKVLAEFGTDVGRWFPMPRRLLNAVKFMRYQKRNPDHLRRSLDVMRERFNIRCGPLQHTR
jgi:hypothetical protein